MLYRLPKDNTVYVFEDFDCMSEVFMDRKIKEIQEKEKQDINADKEKSLLLDEILMLKKIEHAQKIQKEKRRRKKIEQKRRAKEKTEKTEKKKSDDKNDKDNKNSKNEDEKNEAESESDFEDTLKNVYDPSFDDNYYYGYNYGDYSGKWRTNNRMKERVTLADFLELLDGIIEMDGRIIIMTTNQREKMDSALVRPGRIDLDLELRAPSRLLVAHIFRHMYKHLDMEHLRSLFFKYYEYLPDKLVPTARVINCFMYTDPESGIRALLNCGKEIIESEKKKNNTENNMNMKQYDMDSIINLPDTMSQNIWTAESIWENIVITEKNITTKEQQKYTDLHTFFTESYRPVIVTQSSCRSYRIGSEILDINQKVGLAASDGRTSLPQWIQMDFGDYAVNLVDYTIVNAPVTLRLYNWNLEGSNDGVNWEELCTHRNDESLIKMKSDRATFKILPTKTYFQYIRLITKEWSYENDGCDRPRLQCIQNCGFYLQAIQMNGFVVKR
jgi:hypothetical protein